MPFFVEFLILETVSLAEEGSHLYSVEFIKLYKEKMGMNFMNRKYFWLWIVLIAILAFFTGELVNFMMLFLILLTLMEISDEIKKRNGR